MRILSLYLTLILLAPAVSRSAEGEKPRVLILTGANNHNWQETTPFLAKTLERGGFDVDVSDDPDSPALSDATKLGRYAAIVLNLNRNKRWTAEREKNFLNYVEQGGGLVVVHASNNAFDGWDEYDKLVGGTWRSKGTSFPDRGTFHPARGKYEVEVVDRDHPITKGLDPTFTTDDEKYSNLKLQDDIRVLARATQDGKPQPLIFVKDYGKGRVFHTALGHDLKAMETPQFQETLIRGTRWAARRKD